MPLPPLSLLSNAQSRLQVLEILVVCLVVGLNVLVSKLVFAADPIVPCGSVGFWLVSAVVMIIDVVVLVGYRHHLSLVLKAAGAEDRVEVPFIWSKKTTKVLPAIASVAGVGSSLVGLGGGMVFNPLLLEAGVGPEEASATSAVLTFVVALASTLASLGRVQWADFAVFAAVGALSTFLGRFGMLRQIKARGWDSLIIVCLALMLTVTLVAIVGYGVNNIVVMSRFNANFGFGPLCR